MTGLITLLVPAGAPDYPISHGAESFAPYRLDHTDPASGWAVDVPPRVALHFLKNAGFLMAQTLHLVGSAGSIPMVHPDPSVTSTSYSGMSFTRDEDGIFTLPVEGVDDFQSHGFAPFEAARHAKNVATARPPAAPKPAAAAAAEPAPAAAAEPAPAAAKK